MNNLRDTAAELRSKFDGASAFMNGGHQIIKIRRHERDVPEWAKSNEEIQKLLLRSFPKMTTHPLQRLRAGRWARIIHLYFRNGSTYSEVAEEMGESVVVIHSTLKRIRRAASAGGREHWNAYLKSYRRKRRVIDPTRTSLGEPSGQEYQTSLMSDVVGSGS